MDTPTPRWIKGAVVSLLALHALLLLGSLRQNFVVLDEVGHVPSGLSHWHTGDFSMYRVNPPLPRMLATLPVLLAEPQTDYRKLTPAPDNRPEWAVGRDFSEANGERYFDLVCLARLAGVAWSLLGGVLIFCWARDLYGPAAGCLGTALWCLGPNVLAFAQLVVPDVPASVAGLAATYVFWRYLRRPSWRLACFAGLLLGIALLTKFTLLVLCAVWPVLWLLRRPDLEEGALPSRAARLGQAALIGVVSLYVLNLGYGFDGTGQRLRNLPFVSRTFGGDLLESQSTSPNDRFGNRFRDSWLGSVVVPLPAEYVQGIDVQRRDFEPGRFSYLRGEWREGGWWYYYLYALAVKVPLGTWVLVLWALILTLVRHPSSARLADELTLLLPAVIILALVSSQTGFNRHLRYLLPMVPFVVISTAKLAYFFQPGRWKVGLLVLALLLWGAGSSLAVYPHFMSYFNEAAGGPDNGHDHLVHSNIDWGQDLLFLKKWLEEHPEARPLGLAYYNQIDPRLVGIDYQLAPLGPCDFGLAGSPRPEELGPHPGFYAVSVNFVRGASSFAPDGRGGLRHVPLHAYEYFLHYEPIAKAGYSIFIYHITPDEAERVRKQLGLPPVATGPAMGEVVDTPAP